MPRDSSGNYTPPVNSFYPAQANTDIDPNDWNETVADVAAGITNSALPNLANVDAGAVSPVLLSFDPTGATGAIPAQGWVNVVGMESVTDSFAIGGQDAKAALHRTIRDTDLADNVPRVGIQQNISSAGSGRGTGGAATNGRVHIGLLSQQDDYLTNTAGGQMVAIQYIHRVGANCDGEFLGSYAELVSGYFATMESTVNQTDISGNIQRGIQINLGSINNPVPGGGGGTVGGTGIQIEATGGILNNAFSAGQVGGTFQNLLALNTPQNSTAMSVDGYGNTRIGGELSFLNITTTAACQAGGAFDPANSPAYSLIAVSDGNRGGPCLALNYGGWLVFAAIASLPALSTS